ncbi:hypothetical protein A6X21_14245 [Planctopirus hydrillae]|uniref:Permease n=1 Tax=Planctopirus hydrillae TaxID=1841610 RepID=A0A1C3E463_9PLAN|nr:hypothetical protein A6X21_14245 [Planctopirus hydrillae]
MIVLVTFLIRTLQAAVDAAPTLLAGCFCAAFLHVVVGRSRLHAAFSGSGWQGVVKATVYGSLVPVCSLGVIPLLFEMRSARVNMGRIVAFGVSAPLLNPITVCYGLTVLTIPMFLTVVGCALLISISAGLLIERFSTESEPDSSALANPEDERHVHVYGLVRMLNLMIMTLRMLAGPALAWVILGMVISGATAAVIPADSLGHEMVHTNLWAPLLMMAAVTTQFVSPATGIMQMAAMEKVHWSLAAALMLQTAGVGLTASNLIIFSRVLGLKKMLVVLGMIFTLTLAMGFAANETLPRIPTDDDETHALDNLSQPFGTFSTIPPVMQIWASATTFSSEANAWALSLVLIGVVVGGVLRWRRIGLFLPEAVLQAKEEAAEKTRNNSFNRPLSPGILKGLGLAAATAGLLLVVYIYYPPAEEVFDEIGAIRAEALTAINQGQWGIAETRLSAWNQQLSKLKTSEMLRGRFTTEAREEAVRKLGLRLKEVQEAIRKNAAEEAKELSRDLFSMNSECRRIFLNQDTKTAL